MAVELLEAALGYARQRWPVLPCMPRGKRPHPRLAPSGFKNATTDEATIRRWWSEEPTANVGVVCEPGSFALLDLDRHGDTDGLSVAEALHGFEISGPAARTGGGGLHVFYKHPGHGARNRTVAEGVELKVNGYVVAPPSLHPSGRRYEWLEEPTDEPLPELPAWAMNGQAARAPSASDLPPEQLAVADHLELALENGVDEGARNGMATRLAGWYLARGFSEAETLNELVPWNRKNQPPLSDEELQKVVESVARTDARNHPDRDAEQLLTDCTDTGNAEVLAALYGDRLRFDHRQKHWLVWGGHWWVEDADGEPVRLAIESARWRHQQAFERLQGDKAKIVAVWAIRSKDRARVDAALSLAANLRPIADAGEGWDSDPWLLGVANGVLELRTGVLREGRPEDRVTKHSEVAYEPDAECPRWRQFLEEVFSGGQELIGFVRRAIGYCLTGISGEQCFFVLHGAGANGKGVLLEALRYLLGPYAFDAGFSTFEDPGRYPPHPEAMAELAGRRLVTASETRENVRLNEQRLKALSHGDTTSAAFKHKKRFEFRPEAKIWLGLNHKPHVSDDSIGFWRSVRLIPFGRQFIGTDADQELVGKLKAEAPGILVWSVRACLEWQREGLGLPNAVAEATVQYNTETDPIRAFIQDHCTEGPDCKVPTGDLYKAYQDWAEREGMPKSERLSHNGFSRRVGERYERKQIGAERLRVYLGIGLLHSGTA